MNSGTRAEYPYGSNKGLGSKFRGKSRLRQEGSRVRKEIPEEGRRAHRPKHCTDINKDEDNSPKNRNTTNYNQTSSHTFREIFNNSLEFTQPTIRNIVPDLDYE